ncbi:alpha/beta hydrolase fold domain-containing protein [Mycobacterium pseudokansasii]|nr:alpha/beta hydrolase fold domain-containing protein [Mycobacterium pseudokansasii]
MSRRATTSAAPGTGTAIPARGSTSPASTTCSASTDRSKDWQWSEKYGTQPEILRYLNHVADKHDLRRDIRFGTRVMQAHWDDTLSGYRVRTDRGDEIGCRYLVMATGCLSVPKDLDIPGVENFTGELYFTSRWPHEPVDFTGKRVGVVGTGSSGIQSIPLIAAQAAQLAVFQRTPCFSIPAHNGPIAPDKLAQLVDDSAYRQAAKYSFGGVPLERTITPAFSVSADERRQRYERAWQRGELLEVLNLYTDVMSNPLANNDFAEFIRGKIRGIVRDPQTAEALCPTTYPVGAKRLCLDTNYYATFNAPQVRLVNLQDQPLVSVTKTGIATAAESFEFDAIVFATGFDAITGAVAAVDIIGRDGLALKDKWRPGPSTYLGLMTGGFPNLFLIAGPHSPSVLSNMAVSIEQHIDFVADALTYLRAHGFDQIEPTKLAEAGCQLARDMGWPTIVGQALITPVVDTDQARGSYFDNADGYGLTAPLMRWFFDHYADPDVRDDPRIAPLRAPDLSGLPPAIVVSAEFDPLRDEGDAYAEALAAAGVRTRHVRARGHTHLSLSMVDVVVSGAPIRAQIADALRGFFATDAATTAPAQTAS